MKSRLLILILSSISIIASAQIPEDILRYSWQPVNGTARVNAIGGAMGSLGGDISATFTNPAGLAFFKTTDFVFSPGFSFLKNKSKYRGTGAEDKDSYFNLGPVGIVAGLNGSRNVKNSSFSFVLTQTANFNNKVYYTGQNDFSSFAEKYAAELAGSGVDVEQAAGNNSLSFGTRMAAYNFLIDTATLPGNQGPDVVSLSMLDQLKNGGNFLVNQSHTVETRGGIYEPAFGYAANFNDKFYLGGSLGIPIVNYKRISTLREEDATGNLDNDFNFAELKETFTTKGMGINAKIGAIFKASDVVRVGLAVHTPTWYAFDDTYEAEMSVNLDNYRTVPGTTSVTSNQLNGGERPVYKYELISPWKLMLSGSYVLSQVENVRQQKGFITADVEYVTYRSDKFRNAEDYDDNGYYKSLTTVVKDYYKNAVNFRVGGEMKFTTFMGRLGFAYYGNPYKDKELKANKMFVSGGVGYRNSGVFVDLTYVQALQKDINFPYRLSDKANTFANTKGTGGGLMLTVGFKI